MSVKLGEQRPMKEFVFIIEYETGEDAVADQFIQYSSLRSRALYCCHAGRQFWRLERLTGAEDHLTQLDPLIRDPDHDRESISTKPCRGTRRHDVLEKADRRRFLYTHVTDVERCHTIPSLTSRYVDGGAVFERTISGPAHRWRILLPTDRQVGLLYETIQEKLRPGLDFEFDHLDDASGLDDHLVPLFQMPSEQRTALEAAVDAGYYETPREVTVTELADQLELPRSTLSYRLRRAEARLAKHMIGHSI